MTVAGRSDLIDLAVRVHHETHGPRSAWLVSTDGKRQNAVWVPKSQAELEPADDALAKLTLPKWLAEEKGLRAEPAADGGTLPLPLGILIAIAMLAAPASAEPAPLPPERPAFPICERGKPRINCVVDGDTLWLNGEKIRIKGLHTPETFSAECDRETRLGEAATHALARFLWPGPVMLDRTGRDRFGRPLAFVFAPGRDATTAMIAMGHGAAERQFFCAKAKT